MYYAFRYADGRNTTTTGRDASGREVIRIAGNLYQFGTRRARDHYVAEGFGSPVPHSVGQFREAVTTRAMPMGHSAARAEDAPELYSVVRLGSTPWVLAASYLEAASHLESADRIAAGHQVCRVRL